MADEPSHIRDRAETKAAKQAEKREKAAEVWAEVNAGQKAVEDRTARLRAARLANEAEKQK